MAKDTEKSTSDESTERDPGRGRGGLELDCFHAVRDLLDGKVALPEGLDKITPHAVGRVIQASDGLDKPPSSGAIAANFNRWGDLGVINLGEKPQHVKGWSAAFKKAGVTVDSLNAFKAKRREKLAKERAAARAEKSDKPAKATKGAAKKASGTTKKASAKAT